MYKQIMPEKKHSRGTANFPYVRITPKMLFINKTAMDLWGDTGYIRISISTKDQTLILSKAEQAEDAFKLSTVCETRGAKRIETNNALVVLFRSGFPMYMTGKRLPVQVLADGSLAVDFSYKIPVREPIGA